MCVRRRAFALMLVLVAAGAVFAAASSGLVMLRASTVETGAVASRAEAQRVARSASVLVLEGLVARRDAGGGPLTDSPLDAPLPGEERAEEEEEEELEIPPWLREILGEQAEELEERAAERQAARSASRERGERSRREGAALLAAVGLPREPLVFAVGGRPVRVLVRDARHGLSVNASSAEELGRYFEAVGVGFPMHEALANRVKDWVDADAFTRPRSFEREHYRARGIETRDGRAGLLRELLYIEGMTPAVYGEVRRGLTVGGAAVHLGSASREVLIGLGFAGDDLAMLERVRDAGGAVDADAVAEGLSRAGRAVFEERIDVRPSAVLRVEVEVYERLGPGDADDAGAAARAVRAGVGRRFEGLAVMGSRGLREVVLRPEPMFAALAEGGGALGTDAGFAGEAR